MGLKLPCDIDIIIKESLRKLSNADEFLDRMLTRVSKLVKMETAVKNNIYSIRKFKIQVENLQQSNNINNICVNNSLKDLLLLLYPLYSYCRIHGSAWACTQIGY